MAPPRRSETANLTQRLARLIGSLFTARAPMWVSAAATAVVVVALLALFQPQPPATSLSVATYQDQNVIHFQPKDQPGGLGFFNKARRVTKPFKDIHIQISDDGVLVLEWPAVDRAEHYQVNIKLIDNKQAVTVADRTMQTNHLRLENFSAQHGKRYEWTLSGETADAKTFFTSGGFVVN
jgi:hypothetical protein